MSKNTKNEQKENKETKKGFLTKTGNFLKSAAFAWFLIWTAAVMLVGLVTGWTLRSDDNARIESSVMSIVDKAKIEQLKASE